MNSKERLQKAIAGQPTDVTAVAPAYLSLYLDERSSGSIGRPTSASCADSGRSRRPDAIRIDHAEDSRFRAEAILRRLRDPEEPPDWIHTHPAETRDWAERGEMRFVEGRWLYVDRETGETLDMDEAGRLMLPTATRYSYTVRNANADLWDASAGLDTRADIDALVPIRSAEELAERRASSR